MSLVLQRFSTEDEPPSSCMKPNDVVRFVAQRDWTFPVFLKHIHDTFIELIHQDNDDDQDEMHIEGVYAQNGDKVCSVHHIAPQETLVVIFCSTRESVPSSQEEEEPRGRLRHKRKGRRKNH